MVRVQLTAQQRAVLERVSGQVLTRVALCATIVLLRDRRHPVPMIAKSDYCGEDVVRLWLLGEHRAGVAGLEDEPPTARPLDPLARPMVHVTGARSSRCGRPPHVRHAHTPRELAPAYAVLTSSP